MEDIFISHNIGKIVWLIGFLNLGNLERTESRPSTASLEIWNKKKMPQVNCEEKILELFDLEESQIMTE